METVSDLYEDVASTYTRLIRHQSCEAAAALDQMQIDFGAQAALRAGLIITIFNEEIQQHHSIPDIRVYTYLLKDYKGAIPLLEEALTRSMESGGIAQIDKSGWEKWQQILEEHRHLLRNPLEDLVERVREHSPITSGKLEQIYENHGIVAGDYGATALVWLQARIDMFGSHILTKFTNREIQEFTYFQYMGKKAQAVEQFIEMLECFRIEHRPANIRFPQLIPAYDI